MEALSARDKEFVSIGAAIASNCVPCIIYHIKAARELGISDEVIREAVDHAVKVKGVPAEKVLKTAYSHLEGKGEDE